MPDADPTAPSFSLELNHACGYIEFTSSGWWTEDTVHEAEAALERIIASERRRSPLPLRMLVDVRKRRTNSMVVATRIQGVLRRKSPEFDRIGVVLSGSAILLMQGRRMISSLVSGSQRVRLFGPDQLEAARSWLARSHAAD